MGLSKFTSEGSHESFNGAARTSQSKISHHARVNCDCESKADHDESSHRQVHQDEVEWLSELLVLSRDQQCQEVDWKTSADEEKYVEAQHFEDKGICQIILRIFERTPHEPRSVVHGDVKVPAFCAVLHFCGSGMCWLVQNWMRQTLAQLFQYDGYCICSPQERLAEDRDNKPRGSAYFNPIII